MDNRFHRFIQIFSATLERRGALADDWLYALMSFCGQTRFRHSESLYGCREFEVVKAGVFVALGSVCRQCSRKENHH
jgi:hypothetical protein